jgi:hypothetical protein
MIGLLHKGLLGIATWPVVCLLFLAFIVCFQLFDWRRQKLGSETKVLDASFWYNPSDAKQFFEKIGEKGRTLYASTELSVDFVFPLVYGTLFAIFIVRVFSAEWAKWLVLIPLVTTATDLIENSILAYMAWSYTGQASSVTWIAAVFTSAKSLCFAASLIIILIGGLCGIFRRNTPA